MSSLAGRRVLVVEDNFLLAMDLVTTLEQAGAEVVGPAASVHEALEVLDPLPCIASLDVQLRHETSFPIADELARHGVPFVFVTGTPGAILPPHDARVICQKPTSSHMVVAALIDVLARECRKPA